MRRSALFLAAATLALGGIVGGGCGGGGGDEDDVVVSIGSLGDLATGQPPTTLVSGGPTTTTDVSPSRPGQSIAAALSNGDCGAVPRTSEAATVLAMVCEAGISGEPRAWARAYEALQRAEVDPDAPDAGVQREILQKLEPILRDRAKDGGGPLQFRATAVDGPSTSAESSTTEPPAGPDPTEDTGSIGVDPDVTIPDTTTSPTDTAVPSTTVP